MIARLVALAGLACGLVLSMAAAAAAPSVSQLHGTLVLTAGRCAGGHPSGSYLSATFGTKAIRNPRSSCDHGAVTLLYPGRRGLSTQSFSPNSDLGFDRNGDADADAITAPASFGPYRFGLVTSARNLQDAARGSGVFALPTIYVSGSRAFADLRSLQVLYGGLASTSCTGASGYGCWLIGTERATGSYDAVTHRLALAWFTGQSFVGASAGTAVHLTGVFHGAPRPLAAGATVELGTTSFPAGKAQPVAVRTPAAADPPTHRAVARHRPVQRSFGLRATSTSTSTGSPRTFLIGELVVAANLLAFIAGVRRRRR
jgi:hypothetical protein